MAREILQIEEPPQTKSLNKPVMLIVAIAASGVVAVWFAAQRGAAHGERAEEEVRDDELAPDRGGADALAALALKQHADRERKEASAREGALRAPPPATDSLSVLRERLPKAAEVGGSASNEAEAWAHASAESGSEVDPARASEVRKAEIRVQHEERLLERRLERKAEAEAPKTLTLELGDTGASKRDSAGSQEEQVQEREDEQMGALSELSTELLRKSAEQVRTGGVGEDEGLGALEALRGLALGGGAASQSGSAQARHARQLDFFQRGGAQLETGYLGATVQKPLSPYELKAGTVIPGVLISAIDTDAGPGQVLGQVSTNVFDSAHLDHVLIPQGAKIVGTYAGVELGQDRVGVAAVRIVFPNGDVLDLGSMAIADATGRGGLKDRVNHHMLRRVAAALLTTTATVGYQVTRPANPFGAEGAVHQGLGESVMKLANDMAQRDAQLPPTIEIRPGGRFAIMMNKDVVFPGPYEDGYPHRKRDVRRKAGEMRARISGRS